MTPSSSQGSGIKPVTVQPIQGADQPVQPILLVGADGRGGLVNQLQGMVQASLTGLLAPACLRLGLGRGRAEYLGPAVRIGHPRRMPRRPSCVPAGLSTLLKHSLVPWQRTLARFA